MRGEIERLAESGASVETLLREAVELLGGAVPVDGWCGLTVDPATLLKSGGVHESGLPDAALPRLLELEYRDQDVNPFAELARRRDPVAVLHEATGGKPSASARYRDVLAPAGYEHELRLVLRDRGQTWGGLVLLRGPDGRPFSPAERALLGGLSRPLATGVRRALLRAEVAGGRLPDQARLILLDENYDVTSITPAALPLLGVDKETRLPPPAYSVAARARVSGSSSSRMRAPGGDWITLHGWRMDASRVAVTIEPTHPDQVAALVLDAYGLSARERDVTQLVLLGHSTGEIARRLFVSPYTVQDHLKAVFDKTGVRSRRALIAELFFTRYWPRFGEPLP